MNNQSAQALLDFAVFEQQHQSSAAAAAAAAAVAAYMPGGIQTANTFNLMSSGATSPSAMANAGNSTGTPNFFAIPQPPPHHLVNVNSFQSH